ncbi:SpoIIE family protein phosphatase [Nocardioides sp. SYSU DS0663]|uniref:SpoIIE family protein phosphatase n=1 Tax=Nocardioides sp. SYSU DS0663 TaxID=3416445 RepID=UPI003F4B6546
MTETASPHTPAYGAVDLETCDREPIHVPGAVQPHGLLLAVDRQTTRTVMVSANVEAMLGVPLDDALDRPLADLIGEAAATAIQQHEELAPAREPLTLLLPPHSTGLLAEGTVDVGVHLSGDRLVVELEPLARARVLPMSYRSARSAMGRLASSTTVDELTAQLAVEVREITGFDRVMVYRFDQHWNGEVVAEERRADLNPFLGLHYPATDIPAQARRLYTVNWTRLIADISYTPVPLHPVLDPSTGAPLDLSHSTLRSVSPIHVEYLTNMGVTASMSVSLLVDDQLWGLVACHHYSGPHRPSQDARAAAEFLGQVASQMVAERERSDQREAALSAQSTLSRMTARLSAVGGDPLDGLVNDPDLLRLMEAGGVAMCHDGELHTAGHVPSPDVVRRIARLLRPSGDVVASDHLARLDPALAQESSTAAGALCIGAGPDSWLLWLRPELEQVVDWGGDPTNKEIAAQEGPGVRLSPRKSFEKWQQVVRGHSATWESWQADAATGLQTHVNGLMMQRSREQIAVAESLQRSILREQLPEVDGIDVVARYHPASTLQLGGDWWDAVEQADGRVAFVVGDVAGHGVDAVGAMTQIRTAMRAYLFAGDDPGTCLDRLDRLMSGLIDERVATALIALVDAPRRRVELVSAGHPLPLLFDGTSSHDVPVTARPLLGLGEGRAQPTAVEVPPGSTLVLFSDGLVERRKIDMVEASEILRRAGGTGPGADLGAWVDSLVDAVPGERDDDTTVVAIRFG